MWIQCMHTFDCSLIDQIIILQISKKNRIPQTDKVVCILFASDSMTRTPEFLFNSNLKTKVIKKIASDEYLKKNAQFAYLYLDIQTEFLEKLAKNLKIKLAENQSHKNYFDNKVIFLKRLDDKYAQFDVYDLSDRPGESTSLPQQIEALKLNLKSYLNGAKKLQYKMSIPSFYDETTPVYIFIY